MKISQSMAPISQMMHDIIDPILHKKAGIPHGLLKSWEEIIGSNFSDKSRIEKIMWKENYTEDGSSYVGTLVIACEGIFALYMQHQTTEIISRINCFFGYQAIQKIRIIKKSIQSLKIHKECKKYDSVKEGSFLSNTFCAIENEKLRFALQKLSSSIQRVKSNQSHFDQKFDKE